MRPHWIAAIAALLAVSQASADGMTLEQVARMQYISQAVISPQGGHVAFVKQVPRIPMQDEDGPMWRELHVADAQGATRPFVTGHARVGNVDWLPDGSLITFTENRFDDPHAVLYGIPLSGGEARQLVKLETAIEDYALSPDGTRVALLAKDPVDESVISLQDKGFRQKIHEEDWRDTAVWIAGIGSDDAPRRLPVEGTVHDVQWSPDGERLALVVAPTPSVDDSYVFARVRIVNADTGRVRTAIENPGKLGDIAWSPDGNHIAMISASSQHDPLAGRLVVVPSAGGAQRDLLPGLEGHVSNLAWLDADTLAFISHEGVTSRVATLRRDGTAERTVLDAGDPVWTSLSVAGNGDMALTASSPSHPAEAFHLPSGAGTATRLTESNPWLKDVELARQEVVTFTARDGLSIQGILIRPLNERRGRRYPLINMIHGGPEAHYDNAWMTYFSLPGQVAAARGFAVFYPNYRASTGRGVEFSMLDHYDPAGKEFDDIVDGVDHLVESGLVDAARVGITGGSYGGYATAWASTYYSERFAAGVMNVGISDAVAMMAMGDIPWEMYLVHVRVWPWEDWDLYRERSPLYHAAKSRTPLLILHGEADTRVNPAHSLALFRVLKVLDNAPVRLVLYPGEGHGNQNAAARYDYSLRLMRWFEHFLMGDGGEPPPYPLDYSGIENGS